MRSAIEIIKDVLPKCSKLDIKTQDELLEIMWALSIIKPNKINERIFDIDSDLDNFIDFILNIKMFGLNSKNEIRKLIANNGIKVNNKSPLEKISEIEWIQLNNIQFAIIKKGKNQFDFIFNEFVTEYVPHHQK
jgi:hypothetical protein